MANDTADLFAGSVPAWSRQGHSFVAAAEAAREAVGVVATIIAIPLPTGQVKLIGRDLDDNVVYYTECSGSDVGEILAILGVDGPEHNITEMARVFENDGMDLLTAVNVAALINAAAHR